MTNPSFDLGSLLPTFNPPKSPPKKDPRWRRLPIIQDNFLTKTSVGNVLEIARIPMVFLDQWVKFHLSYKWLIGVLKIDPLILNLDPNFRRDIQVEII